MKTYTVFVRLLLAVSTLGTMLSVSAQSDIDLENADNQVGYSIGVNIGINLVQQGITADVEMDAFMAGFTDALANEVRMDEAAMMASNQSFVAEQQAQQKRPLPAISKQAQHFWLRTGSRTVW